MERHRYKKPPIEEAVCDIQFAPGTDWDPTLPGRLFEKLKRTYNEKPRQQQIVEAQLQGGTAEGSQSTLQHRLGKMRVQLLAENGTRIVGISQDQLSVHMLRPYTKWEDFRPRIMDALNAYGDVAAPEGVTRLGLRYINRIVIDESDPDLGKYFEIPPKFPKVEPATRILGFFNRKESEYLDKPIRIVVTFADMEPRPSEKSSYILDLDIIWIRASDPIPLAEVPEVMDDMKTRHRQVFESLITNETRKLFNDDRPPRERQ
jgi:uncharacterized protein (TIGR04255 family)